MDNREIELKYVFKDHQNFEDLKNRLVRLGGEFVQLRKQVNYFFDADRWLDDKRATLRLRKSIRPKRVVWYLTLKGPNQYESNQRFNGRMEIEEEIDSELAEDALMHPMHIQDRLRALLERHTAPRHYREIPEHNWKCLGHFENSRELWRLSDIAETLELDHAKFPGDRERLELEIEVDTPERAIKVNRWALDYLLSDSELIQEKRGKARYFFESIGYARNGKK